MYKISKCSKNYINCRKHPSRANVTTAKERINEDYTYARKTAREALVVAQTDLANLTEDSSAYQKNKIRKQLKEAETAALALHSEVKFKTFLENPVWQDGKKVSNNELSDIRLLRENIKKDITSNMEREEYYAKDTSMNSFQSAVADVLVDEGEFTQNDESRYWGDTRGAPDYQARGHFKSCGVRGVNSYDETASWSDSFHSDDTVGIKAELSCNCGDFYKRPVYFEPTEFGSMISKLMNR